MGDLKKVRRVTAAGYDECPLADLKAGDVYEDAHGFLGVVRDPYRTDENGRDSIVAYHGAAALRHYAETPVVLVK